MNTPYMFISDFALFVSISLCMLGVWQRLVRYLKEEATFKTIQTQYMMGKNSCHVDCQKSSFMMSEFLKFMYSLVSKLKI